MRQALREGVMSRRVLQVAVLLFVVAASPAVARAPVAVSGGRIALETVCGALHGVHVTTDPGGLTVQGHPRLARCADGRWVPTASLAGPGDYRLSAGRTRRYARVLAPVTDVPVSFRVRNVNRSTAP